LIINIYNLVNNYNGNLIRHYTKYGSNYKKISGLSKAGSVSLWGVFAVGGTSKTWHCKNCKIGF